MAKANMSQTWYWRWEMRRNIAIFLILIALFSQTVMALGVTPARNVVDFTPGLERTYTLNIINSEQRDVKLVLSSQGELQDAVLVGQSVIEMSASEPSREVQYTLKLPSQLSPGTHAADLFVVQLPDEFVSAGEMSVGAAVAVVSQIIVEVPYPGKYAEAKLNAQTQEDGSVKFFVIVESLGEFDLPDVGAEISITDPSGVEIATVRTAKDTIPSKQRKELVGEWMPDEAVSGKYHAKVSVNYGEGIASAEQEFTLGEDRVRLSGIEVNDFALGEIAKFEIIAENVWNENIEGVYAELLIYDEDGNVLADVKSPTYDIASGEKEVMQAFWDTKGVDEGSYDSTLFLRYAGGGEEKDLTLEVTDDSITIIGFGYHISSLSAGGGSLTAILVGVIVFLVIVNLSWFMYLRKRMKKK
jgi:hypothetical protein